MSIRIDGTNTTANPGITGSDTDTGLQIGTNELKLVTGGTARATVDDSGRLMIGTTTEGEHTADDLTVATSGDTGITIRSGTSSSGKLFFSDGTSSADEYRGFVEYDHSDNDMLFGTDSTERMRILSDGGLTFNGDTAQANALDDYEEGTWTPTFTCTDANFTYSDQSGLYTKVGNIVHINFRLQITARTAGTGALYVSGLPFTPVDNRCVMSISPTFGSWGSNNAPNSGFSASSAILLKKFDSSDARDTQDTNVDPSLVSTAGLIGSMSYTIA